MPSPFPGMDPYLEGSLWMSVHTDLAVGIARQLNRQIRAALYRPDRRADTSWKCRKNPR